MNNLSSIMFIIVAMGSFFITLRIDNLEDKIQELDHRVLICEDARIEE